MVTGGIAWLAAVVCWQGRWKLASALSACAAVLGIGGYVALMVLG
ncbi:MAG: hypothetical protein AB7O62_23140 [Pirellulales bacterium]